MGDEGKDYKCCPHCFKVSESDWKFDDFRGDGNCKKCEGTGKIDDSFRAQIQEFTVAAMSFGVIHDNVPYEIDCPKCDGSGQCQTCGGTGRVKKKRFEGTEDLDDRNENDEDESDDDEYDYDDEEDDDEDDYANTYDDDDDYDTYKYDTPKEDLPPPKYLTTLKYCSFCGAKEEGKHSCKFPKKHSFVTGYIFDFCSKCGIIAGQGYSECHFPYSEHNFIRGYSNEYCIKCGTKPSNSVTKCHFPYENHSFLNSDIGVFCSKCGKTPSGKEKCHFPYDDHSFIPGQIDNYKCAKCGITPGKRSKCKFPYDTHDFIKIK